MRAGIVVNVTAADRRRLEAIVADRSAPQKHVWRANIILATADGCGTAEIMRRSGKSNPVAWRWQARFMAEGVAGLTRDKTRKPGKPPLSPPPCSGSSISRSGPAGRSNPLDRPDVG
jgi:Winged helix-turn helix